MNFFVPGDALQNWTVPNKLGGLGKLGKAKDLLLAVFVHTSRQDRTVSQDSIYAYSGSTTSIGTSVHGPWPGDSGGTVICWLNDQPPPKGCTTR
jgi:hypothetical protein